MGLDGPAVFVILLVVLLLFGDKKIHELMKGLGKGVKEFKDGMKGDEKSTTPSTNEDDKK